MPDYASPDAGNTGPWCPREQIVEQFDEAWKQGPRPAIADFWRADDAEGVALLAELIRIDLTHRLKAGEPARVDDYLTSTRTWPPTTRRLWG